jgi:hypothetical protein
MTIFRHNPALTDAVAVIADNASRQPKPGTIIRANGGEPIRVKLQVREDEEAKGGHAIFAYATVVPPDNFNSEHTARPFTSDDFHGTKAIILTRSRTALLAQVGNDPVLGGCEIVPVMALKVVAVAKSGRSVTVEVIEFCDEKYLEVCAGLVAAIEAGEDEDKAEAAYYDRLQILKDGDSDGDGDDDDDLDAPVEGLDPDEDEENEDPVDAAAF